MTGGALTGNPWAPSASARTQSAKVGAARSRAGGGGESLSPSADKAAQTALCSAELACRASGDPPSRSIKSLTLRASDVSGGDGH